MKHNQRTTRILIVDDNDVTCEVIRRSLEPEEYHINVANSVAEAVAYLEHQTVELVITDYKMPKSTGLELIRHIRDHFNNIGIVMLTGYGSISSAVEAMKEGADEYITKPFTTSELLNAVSKTLRKLKENKNDTSAIYDNAWEKFKIIGRSRAMCEVYDKIEKACRSDATILITGENGTGKELVARAIHYHHPSRLKYPFVPVNCPGIPAALFESELFGSVKGAFTGAIQNRQGFFQTAEKGSIFLDEISELPYDLQAKLLRVLQEKEIFRIGETKLRKTDVRIIAATNKNLENLIEKGLFRQDLFFRLNLINIDIPPLRHRGDDIVVLAKHFALKYAKELQIGTPVITDKALNSMKSYSWPGNVRELENFIHRILIMNDSSRIDRSDFPVEMKSSISPIVGLNLSLDEMTKKYIRDIVRQTGGNKAKALKILKIDRKTLLKKLQE